MVSFVVVPPPVVGSEVPEPVPVLPPPEVVELVGGVYVPLSQCEKSMIVTILVPEQGLLQGVLLVPCIGG
ncbi:hypothetical protein P8625_00140 [Tenacibaculum tangerinum]|uniref:Secreted protein n=1 Tax=Tenacibaculum tangerinum TaxID=3038772 RepID=A0ABY8L2W4_9FLAO|nr:hypothetical protein [Tenacibaculum tangerinum]WGH75606.1 hypothetical protein P8625_00140 [Tenacibaculum tangerinum]